MRKKLLTVALAATMAVSSVFSAFAETLTGTAWWTGMAASTEAELSGDGTVTFEVSVTSGDANGNAALSAEMFTTDPKYYFTIGSDGNAWFAETANATDVKVEKPYEDGSENNPKLTVGHKYEVSINRTGKVFKANYYDVTDGKELCRMTGTTSVDSPATMKMHLMVQLGTMDINVKNGAAILDPAAVASNDDKKEDTTTAAPSNDKKEDATTAAPAGNKDNVTPSKTGDTSAVAVVAIVAFGAAVAVVASKKKVTE